MPKFIVQDHTALTDALCEAAGVNRDMVSRIVLDLQVGSPGRVYFNTFADSSILDVELKAGIDIELTSDQETP